MNPSVQNKISLLIGKTCCRQRVGDMHSLSLGFGAKIPHKKNNLPDGFYGEWEIGTYMSSWRIILDERIICASQDDVESIAELNDKLRLIQFGKIISIDNIGFFDVRVTFSGGLYVEFIICSVEQDEAFHIIGPNDLYIEWSLKHHWKIGDLNKPWI